METVFSVIARAVGTDEQGLAFCVIVLIALLNMAFSKTGWLDSVKYYVHGGVPGHIMAVVYNKNTHREELNEFGIVLLRDGICDYLQDHERMVSELDVPSHIVIKHAYRWRAGTYKESVGPIYKYDVTCTARDERSQATHEYSIGYTTRNPESVFYASEKIRDLARQRFQQEGIELLGINDVILTLRE